MQAQYRSYQQGTPSRASHGGGNRRGIGMYMLKINIALSYLILNVDFPY